VIKISEACENTTIAPSTTSGAAVSTNVFGSSDAIVIGLPLLGRFYHTLEEKKSGGRIPTAALKLSNLPEQGFYEDLYLTEQPYGFVSGVATDLPDND
jgi:hypothetical protein